MENNNELIAVTKQRNELENKLEKSKSYKNVMKRDNARLRKQLTAVTEQRDRLAVALKELRNNESMSLGGAAYEIVEQALQSLTPNRPNPPMTARPTAPPSPQTATGQSLGAMPCCLSSFLDRVICGDNCETLAAMPAESVDLVVTSPPYDDLRTYGGHSWDFPRLAGELTRVLKPGGVIVWVVADATVNGSETLTSMRQAIHFKDVCGLNVWDTMIYQTNKPPINGRRYEPTWEYMLVISKGAPKTWNPLREKSLAPGVMHRGGMRGKDGQMRDRTYNNRSSETKVRGNIWYLPRSPHSDGGAERHGHPATFPLPLAKDHVASWSNPGDVVLDPFAGSGTTLKAAKELNRRFIGVEINPAYVEICNRRIAQEVLDLDFRKPCPRCGYCGFIEDADMNLAGICPECHGESAKFYSDNKEDQERKSPASDGSNFNNHERTMSDQLHKVTEQRDRLAEAARTLPDYDAGLLNDFGGGDAGWWQDYIRAEIGRANEYWRAALAAVEGGSHEH